MATTEITPGLTVDTTALTTFLGSCVPGSGAVEDVELLVGGNSNLTLVVTHGAMRTVLRRQPLGSIPAQAHDMHREYEVLRMLTPRFAHVPTVFGFCGDTEILGAPFYAMEFVEGTIVQAAGDLRPFALDARRSACDDVVRVLAELHALPPTSLSLHRGGSSGNVMERHLQRWHQRWNDRVHRDLPEVDRLADSLRRSVPARDETTFVHGDYRLGNIVIDPLAEDRPVRAVLDWELATFGDPLTDLAHLLAYWEGTGDVRSHRAQFIAEQASLPSAYELAEMYAAHSGRSVEHLPVFMAFEHWRAAIIKEAIYQRRVEVGASIEQIDDARQGVDNHLLEAARRMDAARHPAR